MDGTDHNQSRTIDVPKLTPERTEVVTQRLAPPTVMLDTSVIQSLAVAAEAARQLQRSVLTPLHRATSNATRMLDELHELVKLARVLPATILVDCERWYLRHRLKRQFDTPTTTSTRFAIWSSFWIEMVAMWSLFSTLDVHRSAIREIKRTISYLAKLFTKREIELAEVVAASLRKKSSQSASCINPIRAPDVLASSLVRTLTHTFRSNSCLTPQVICSLPTPPQHQLTSAL